MPASRMAGGTSRSRRISLILCSVPYVLSPYTSKVGSYLNIHEIPGAEITIAQTLLDCKGVLCMCQIR